MQYISAESETHRNEDVCDINKRKRIKRFWLVTSMMNGHFAQQAGFFSACGILSFYRNGSLSPVMTFSRSQRPVCQRHSSSRLRGEAHSHLPAAVQTQRAAAEG